MAGLKAWEGSAFVDGQPRIWNGAAFVAPSACHVWDGSGFVKVWPTFAPQRMVKSGNWVSGSNFELIQVTGWTSDGTYPAQVTASKLVVAGAGPVTVTATLDSQTDDDAVTRAVKLMHNDVVVATGDLTAYNNRRTITVAAQATVEDGDTIWLQTQTNSSINAKIYAGSTIEVVSA